MEPPKNWQSLKRHPLSAEYEDIEGPIFDEMVSTLKEYGVIDRKITIHEGMVLDGWQMMRACIKASITPDFTKLADGMDPDTFVKIKNDLRRQTLEEKVIARINARKKESLKGRTEGKSIRAGADVSAARATTVRAVRVGRVVGLFISARGSGLGNGNRPDGYGGTNAGGRAAAVPSVGGEVKGRGVAP